MNSFFIYFLEQFFFILLPFFIILNHKTDCLYELVVKNQFKYLPNKTQLTNLFCSHKSTQQLLSCPYLQACSTQTIPNNVIIPICAHHTSVSEVIATHRGKEKIKKLKKKIWRSQHQTEFGFQPLIVEIPLGKANRNTSECSLAHLLIMFKIKDIPDFLDCLKWVRKSRNNW